MLKWLCIAVIVLGFGVVHAIDLPVVYDRDINVQINEYFAKIDRIKASDQSRPSNNEIAQGLNVFVESGKITLDEMKKLCSETHSNPAFSSITSRIAVLSAFNILMDMHTFYPRVNAALQKALNGEEVSADEVKLVRQLEERFIEPEKWLGRYYYTTADGEGNVKGDEYHPATYHDLEMMLTMNMVEKRQTSTPAYQQALDVSSFAEGCQKGRILSSEQKMRYMESIKQMSARIPAMAELAPLVEARFAEVRVREAEAQAERARAAKFEAEEKEAKAAAERESARIAAEEAEAEKEKIRIADEAARAREAAEQERLEKEEAARKLADKPLPVVPTPVEPKPVITPKLPAPGTDATPEKLVKRGKTALAATGIFGFGVGLGGVFLVKKVARLVSLNRLIKAAESSESVTFGKLRSLKNERSELVGELKLLAPATTLMAIAAVYAHRKSYEAAAAA